jgi:hypothetical protein
VSAAGRPSAHSRARNDADIALADLRGTAFGVFNLASGVSLRLASAAAGAIWQDFGAPAALGAGAGVAYAALVLLVLVLQGGPAPH